MQTLDSQKVRNLYQNWAFIFNPQDHCDKDVYYSELTESMDTIVGSELATVPVNLESDESHLFITLFIPGFTWKDITIEIFNQTNMHFIQVKGQKKTTRPNRLRHQTEYNDVFFSRDIHLNGHINERALSTELKKGVLHICIQKSVSSKVH